MLKQLACKIVKHIQKTSTSKEWKVFCKTFLPDYHLAKNPPSGEARRLARTVKERVEVIPEVEEMKKENDNGKSLS